MEPSVTQRPKGGEGQNLQALGERIGRGRNIRTETNFRTKSWGHPKGVFCMNVIEGTGQIVPEPHWRMLLSDDIEIEAATELNRAGFAGGHFV